MFQFLIPLVRITFKLREGNHFAFSYALVLFHKNLKRFFLISFFIFPLSDILKYNMIYKESRFGRMTNYSIENYNRTHL